MSLHHPCAAINTVSALQHTCTFLLVKNSRSLNLSGTAILDSFLVTVIQCSAYAICNFYDMSIRTRIPWEVFTLMQMVRNEDQRAKRNLTQPVWMLFSNRIASVSLFIPERRIQGLSILLSISHAFTGSSVVHVKSAWKTLFPCSVWPPSLLWSKQPSENSPTHSAIRWKETTA